MRKIIFIFIIIFFISPVFAFSFKQEKKPVLYLTSTDPSIIKVFDESNQQVNVFEVNQKIYYTIYVPEGFKSPYIKYQIVKQDDNAHIGGYTRIRNQTKKVNDKYYFSDYFVISQKGKYYIQIFDIQNLNHWLAIGAFQIVD